MSGLQVENDQQAQSQTQQQQQIASLSSSSSPSNSISLIKLDELSSFGATKQSRLPTLIKLNSFENIQDQRNTNSMPAFSVEQMETSQPMLDKPQQQAASLPAQLPLMAKDKENLNGEEQNLSEDFQMVDMGSVDPMMGPSLPQMDKSKACEESFSMDQQRSALISSQQFNQHPSHLGDSLIEMIVNLRNENQNLVRALETNNEYVKDRIDEFKRVSEEAKKREAKFALEKADQEHQVRKLQRQNMVLSERLKSMEVKLKEMKLEVGESLVMAHSSKASSIRDEHQVASGDNLYPNLENNASDLFANSALQPTATTMQMDATSGELYLTNQPPTAPAAMEAESCSPRAGTSEAKQIGSMSKEELNKRFDAEKGVLQPTDDPMLQCDRLEQQLNDIGKRDYEICLLQQQLNIYRQDYRLERMANLEAKLQIEKLKTDIDRLCLERLNVKQSSSDEENRGTRHHLHRGSHHRTSGGVRFEPVAAAAGDVISKLGHQLGKKAARSAAKAAKYASKQAHREEKAASIAAAAAAKAAYSSGSSAATGGGSEPTPNEHHSRGRHHHHHRHAPGQARGIRSEVVSDLLSTANKAMLTGYKMASTHVNLALDKLSQFEQSQASNLAVNKPQQSPEKPSAPPMGLPSLD